MSGRMSPWMTTCRGAVWCQLGVPLSRQECGLLAADGLRIDVVWALRYGDGLPLKELHAVVLDEEGCSSSAAFLGTRLVGSIELDKEGLCGWRCVLGVEEHFALADASCGFDGDVDAAAAAVVVVIGDVGLLVWCVAVLVQEAVPGVMLISNEDCGPCSDFLQGRYGKGWVQLSCQV